MIPPLISIEDHFCLDQLSEKNHIDHFPKASKDEWLDNDKQQRVREMDKGGVQLQVLSYRPVHLNVEEARAANSRAHELSQAQPARLAAFATLPMMDVDKAVAELEYCIKELKFVGALIPNHLNGEFYDAEKFWPIFRKAVELDVPIYLHPAPPSEAIGQLRYQGNYPDNVAWELGTYGLGWHQDVALHFLRLYFAGLFDHLPKLKLIIGHMGEMLPYQLDRIKLKMPETAGNGSKKKSLQEVWDNNLWITTSGMFSLAPMACLLQTTKVERILFSVDYPPARNEQGLEFMKALEASGMVTKAALEGIAHKHAENLLGLHTVT
jgi:predicted TIM-barrel fold metal-dependent hydrolase